MTVATPKVIAILQARVSSSRLPGKVLLPILGKTMLERQCERILRSQRINKLIIATSNEPTDQAIIQLAEQLNIPSYSGSLNDVLGRFYHAAQTVTCDHIVRLTGDCPLIDAEIIDKVIELHLQSAADYTSNCQPPSLPDGLDVEIFSHQALTDAYIQAKKPSEREHVTPYIRQRPDTYKLKNYQYERDLSSLRWTVDEATDFELVSKIYAALYPYNNAFTTHDILQLLKKQPELMFINAGIERNEGYLKSLINEGLV